MTILLILVLLVQGAACILNLVLFSISGHMISLIAAIIIAIIWLASLIGIRAIMKIRREMREQDERWEKDRRARIAEFDRRVMLP